MWDRTPLAPAALGGHSSVTCVCVTVPAAGCVLSKGLWVLSGGVWPNLCPTGALPA